MQKQAKTFFLAIMLASMAPVPVDLVFCQGSDGHSEVELATFGSCFDCFEVDDHHAEAFQSQHGDESGSHCGSCTDLILSPEPSNSNRLKLAVSAPVYALPAQNVVAALTPVYERDAQAVLLTPPLLNNQRMDAIRSVILLI